MLFLEKLIKEYQGSVGPKPWNQLKQVRKKILRDNEIESELRREGENFGLYINTLLMTDFIDGYVEKEGNYYKLATTFSKHLYQSDVDFYGNSLVEDMAKRTILVELPYALRIGELCGTAFFAKFHEVNGRGVIIFNLMTSEQGSMQVALQEEHLVLKKYIYGFYMDIFFYDEKGSLKLEGKDDNSLFLLKCLIYIFSANPDLSPEKKEPRIIEKKDNVIFFPKKDENPFDITNVGYSFHERHYSVSETAVNGHYRMQPFGPGRKEVKKIWIDTHKRNYGN